MLDTTALADAGSGIAAEFDVVPQRISSRAYFRFNWTTRQTG